MRGEAGAVTGSALGFNWVILTALWAGVWMGKLEGEGANEKAGTVKGGKGRDLEVMGFGQDGSDGALE